MRTNGWIHRATKPAKVLAAAVLCAVAAETAQAAVYYWDPNGSEAGVGGAGTWSLTNAYWYDGSIFNSWAGVGGSSAVAEFGGTGGGVVVDGTLSVNGLHFTKADYTLGATSGSGLSLVGSSPQIMVDKGITTTVSSSVSGAAVGIAGGGTLQYGNANVFSASTVVEILGGATLNLGSYATTVGGLTLTDGTVRSGVIRTATSNFTLRSGTVDATLKGISDAVGEGAVITKEGSGTVIFGNSASISGAKTLNIVAGTIDLGASAQTVGVLNMTTGRLAGTLSAGFFKLYDGVVDANLIGENGTLTKSGTGTVALNGQNTYNGATNINKGTLVLNGSIGGGGITVNSGATFGGSGNTTSTVGVYGGLISPALDAVGTLSTGPQTWDEDTTYLWNMKDPFGTMGSGWDLISVSGQFQVTGDSGLTIFGLDTTGLNTKPSYSWTVVATTGGVNLISSVGLDSSRVVWGTAGTLSLEVVGNNLDLVFTPVPEPRDYAMLLGVATIGIVGYRRWRRGVQALA